MRRPGVLAVRAEGCHHAVSGVANYKNGQTISTPSAQNSYSGTAPPLEYGGGAIMRRGWLTLMHLANTIAVDLIRYHAAVTNLRIIWNQELKITDH